MPIVICGTSCTPRRAAMVGLPLEDFPDGSPFVNHVIHSHDPLRQQTTRQRCPTCQKMSAKYFCYYCHSVMMDRALIPRLELPVQFKILRHFNELVGKNTAVHAKIIAPDHVSLYSFPADLAGDRLGNWDRTLVLYPSQVTKYLTTFLFVGPLIQ